MRAFRRAARWLPAAVMRAAGLTGHQLAGMGTGSPPDWPRPSLRRAAAMQEALPALFQRVLALKGEHGGRMRMHERVAYIVFTINAFQVGPGAGGLLGRARCLACLAASVFLWASVGIFALHCAVGWPLSPSTRKALPLQPSAPPPLPHPQSLEDEAVRAQMLRLVSLPLWHALSRGRLQLELHDQPQVGG